MSGRVLDGGGAEIQGLGCVRERGGWVRRDCWVLRGPG